LHGVIGYSGATGKAGVLGNSPGGYGVRGISTGMAGVHGYSDNSYVILGESANDNAVKGVTGATNEWIPAVYGRNQGAGDGVYGWSQARHGVFGVTYSVLGDHAGIYGVNNGGGPAIIADGRLIVRDAELRVEDDDGDLYVEGQYHGNIGQGGAPFPRPAFDSGWIEASEGAIFTLGVSQYLPASTYDRDHFVVDVMTKPGLWWGNRELGCRHP
jgi:hypothetical protein